MNIESSFYVIRSDCGYWHYNITGALVTCWGDPLTAERFDSPKDAREFLEMTLKSRGRYRDDGGNPRVARVKFAVADVRHGGGAR